MEVSQGLPCSSRKTTLTAGHYNQRCDNINKQAKMCSITHTTPPFLRTHTEQLMHVCECVCARTQYACLSNSVEDLVRWFPWKWEYEIRTGWGFHRTSVRHSNDSWRMESGLECKQIPPEPVCSKWLAELFCFCGNILLFAEHILMNCSSETKCFPAWSLMLTDSLFKLLSVSL